MKSAILASKSHQRLYMTPEQQEIERLRSQIERLQGGSRRAKEYSAREDTYEGHPMLAFEGPSARPFKMGVAKLKTVRACLHKVDAFLAKYDKPGSAPNRAGDDDQDVKI